MDEAVSHPATEHPDEDAPVALETEPSAAESSADLSNFRFGALEVERLVCGDVELGILDALQRRDPNAWNITFPPLTSLPKPSGPKRPIRICIATEEIVGPVRNGGIGTTYAYLAEMLGLQGIDVSILYLRGQEVENGTIDQWIEHYAAKGVRFVPVPNYAAVDRLQTGADRWLQAPYNMMRYLLQHPMDVVHVSEWRGSAYLSLVAKKQGLAFAETLFIVKTSSPWLWNRLYGSQPVDRVEDLTKIFAERQSVELADMVVGGSTHLLRWMASQGYKLPPFRTFVQPNVVFFDHLKPIIANRSNTPGSRVPIKEIVFFGRLEARKGIFLFCETINRLINYNVEIPPKISFMGKPGARLTARPEQDILEYIEDVTRDWPCEVEIHTEFQQLDALEYLLGGDRLAVMPSIIENSSLAVYEATMCGIPFVASSSGGTPELVAEEDRAEVLCEAHPIPLADRIQSALAKGGYIARPNFDNDHNLVEWRSFHDALEHGLAETLLTKRAHPVRTSDTVEVTVCIYHCKDGDALRTTLESLAGQDQKPDQVLVGLDCPAAEARIARDVAAECGLDVQCTDCLNYDAGLAFNVMARDARSPFMLFLWSGTKLRAEALNALERTVLASGAEVVNFFHRVVRAGQPDDTGYLNAAILGSVTEAFFRSDLSPMPIMVAAKAFRALGGFSTDYRVLGCEQELVARAQVQAVTCTTALMEMGSVEAWDPAWITAKCYDEAVSYFRAIRPQIAAAPLALRDMMLLAKGLQAKAAGKKGAVKRAPQPQAKPKPQAQKKTNSAFSQLFALLDAGDFSDKAPNAKKNGKDTGAKAGQKGVPAPARVGASTSAIAKRESDYISTLRKQLHRLPAGPDDNFAGRLLGIQNMTLVGWVCDHNKPNDPLTIECFREGRQIASVKADMNLGNAISMPADLRGHAFRLTLPRLILKRSCDVVLKIAGTPTVLATASVGHRTLKSAGYDGYCEVVRPGAINGWAYKVDDPEANIDVALFVDGEFLVRLSCSRGRDDLKAAGIGFGNYGFEFFFPKALRDGQRRIVRAMIAETGTQLNAGRFVLQGNSLKLLRAGQF